MRVLLAQYGDDFEKSLGPGALVWPLVGVITFLLALAAVVAIEVVIQRKRSRRASNAMPPPGPIG